MPWIKYLLAALLLWSGAGLMTGCSPDLDNPEVFVDTEEDEYWDGYDFDEEDD
jgi:hypothetical protein